MKNFVFAFPLSVTQENTESFLAQVHISSVSLSIMVPGCSIPLDVFIQPPVPALTQLFEEHSELSLEEKSLIENHASLLFIRGSLRDKSSLMEVNSLIQKIIAAGTLGIYAEHSGAAFSASAFNELNVQENPLDFWLNFVESKGVLFSLGLETFSLPDLSINAANENSEELRDLLLTTAEYLYLERVPAVSGTKVEVFEQQVYELCKENSPLFSKNDPEWNRLGTFRLIRR